MIDLENIKIIISITIFTNISNFKHCMLKIFQGWNSHFLHLFYFPDLPHHRKASHLHHHLKISSMSSLIIWSNHSTWPYLLLLQDPSFCYYFLYHLIIWDFLNLFLRFPSLDPFSENCYFHSENPKNHLFLEFFWLFLLLDLK